MKLVYLAGPYSGKTHDYKSFFEIENNISLAKQIAIWCATNKIAYFCPHLNSAHFEVYVPDVPVEFWYEMDLTFAYKCDALLLFGHWHYSKGAMQERQIFVAANKPVFIYELEKTNLFEWYHNVPISDE